MNLKEYSGIFLVIVGLIAIIAYVLEWQTTGNPYLYAWPALVGIMFLACGSYLYIDR